MTPDRDTLSRDLLTLPALVEAPEEVVRGLVLRNPWGSVHLVRAVDLGAWAVGLMLRTPADLHAAGWRVDLDAPATAGVLGRLWLAAMRERGMAIEGDMVPLDGECLARALMEVARVD